MKNPNPNLVTIEIYRKDKRVKGGEKLVSAEDVELNSMLTRHMLNDHVKSYIDTKERFEIHTTYVERQNVISGDNFWERYDTPYCCSPSSETYWSM